MSMHIEGPWLSTTGKKKGKKKFRTAEAARKAADQKEQWNALLQKYGATDTKRKETVKPLSFKPTYRGADAPKIPSKGDGVGVATAKESKTYTGDKCLGVAQMHKSNAVPVFSTEEATAISKMRR